MIYCAADVCFNSPKNAALLRKEVKDYNEWLVKKWNSRVTEKDTVFILGTFYESAAGIGKILNSLNGEKIVIPSSSFKKEEKENWKLWGISVWYCTLHSGTDTNYSFSFCNEKDGEITCDKKEKYTCYFSDDYHGNPLSENRLNISFGMWNYEPLSVEEIPNIIRNLEGKIYTKK